MKQSQSSPRQMAPIRAALAALFAVLLAVVPTVSAQAEAGPPPPVSGPVGYLVTTLQGASADSQISVYEKVGVSWNFAKVDIVEYVVSLPPGTYTAEFKDAQTGEIRWYGGGIDAASATAFTILEDSFTRISDAFVGPPAIPGGYVTLSGTPRFGLPMTAVTGWDSDPSVTVSYVWKTFSGPLATTKTFTVTDPLIWFVTLEATGHKTGYSDTTVSKFQGVRVAYPNTLVTTLDVDRATGTFGQFNFSNDQAIAVLVEATLNGAPYASVTVPAGTPDVEGVASIPFSNLAPGDIIAVPGVTYTKPEWWRPTIAQTEAAAGGSLPITAEGFAPGTEVNISLHSTHIALGTLIVGANGKLNGQVVIPAGVPAGSHTLAFSVGGVMRGQAPLTVRAAGASTSGEQLAATGSDVSPLGGIAAVFLLGGAVAIAVVSRRRGTSRA